MARRVHAARALAVALALLPMAMAQAPAGASPEATVISVGDGDTIRVRMNRSALPLVRGVYGLMRIGLRSRALQAFRHSPDR